MARRTGFGVFCDLADIPEAQRVHNADGSRIAAWWIGREKTDRFDDDTTFRIAVWARSGRRLESYTRTEKIDLRQPGRRRGRRVTGLYFGDDGTSLYVCYDEGADEHINPTSEQAEVYRQQARARRRELDAAMRALGAAPEWRWSEAEAREALAALRAQRTREAAEHRERFAAMDADPDARTARDAAGTRVAGWWLDERTRAEGFEYSTWRIALWDAASGEEIGLYTRTGRRRLHEPGAPDAEPACAGEREGYHVTGLHFDDAGDLWIEYDGAWSERAFVCEHAPHDGVDPDAATRRRRFLFADDDPARRRATSEQGARVAGWWIDAEAVAHERREARYAIAVWDGESGDEIAWYRRCTPDFPGASGHEQREAVRRLRFAEDGRDVVVTYGDGSEERLGCPRWRRFVHNADGSRVAGWREVATTASSTEREVHYEIAMWDADTGERLHAHDHCERLRYDRVGLLEASGIRIIGLRFGEDGRLLVRCRADRDILRGQSEYPAEEAGPPAGGGEG